MDGTELRRQVLCAMLAKLAGLDQMLAYQIARIAPLGSMQIQVARLNVWSACRGPVRLIARLLAAQSALLAITPPHMEVLIAPSVSEELPQKHQDSLCVTHVLLAATELQQEVLCAVLAKAARLDWRPVCLSARIACLDSLRMPEARLNAMNVRQEQVVPTGHHWVAHCAL